MDSLVLGVGGPELAHVDVCPATLVEAICVHLPLCRCGFQLVESVSILQTGRRLPAIDRAAYQDGGVVMSVPFVRFQTFCHVVLSIIAVRCRCQVEGSFHSFYVRF